MARKVRDSWRHKELKSKARAWLLKKGYEDIREEFPVLGLTIDIVGFQDGKPSLGIECGSLNQHPSTYGGLPFTILHMALRGGS